MAKTFKKGQEIIAILPNGEEVKGEYIEPYGMDGHSFYRMVFDGTDARGNSKFKKVRYGVKECNIRPVSITSKPSFEQYRAWLSRATALEKRMLSIGREMNNNLDPNEGNRLLRKYERTSKQIVEISKKIEEYERAN